MYPTTRDFVRALDAAGELRRVRTAVSPILEVAQITDRVSKSNAPVRPSASARQTDPHHHHLGGHALLFENVEGSDIPVLINAWGSYSRMERALGCLEHGFESIAAEIAALTKPEPPRSLSEAFEKARQFLPLLRTPPKRLRGSGLCQEVVVPEHRIDLTRLPIIRCWPHDGNFAALGYPEHVNDGIPGLSSGPDWNARSRGRYITLAGIHTIHADDLEHPSPPSHNIGMYRVQLFGPRLLAMHWHMHHDGARHWRSWKARGKPMPVAIALGGESVTPYAATAPLPPGISELLFAGFLNRAGIPMVRAKTVPLWVPAHAEIVIEGWVSEEAGGPDWDPRTPHAEPLGPGAVFEGPFGDHTGFYSLPDRYPLLHVSAITHRRDPIYPTTIVGLPPQEDYYLGKATERLFLPLLKTILPDIEDYDLPMFGAFHNCAAVRIKKHYPFHARRVMHGIWGAGQMSWTKSIIVVDHDVNVHDTPAVLRAVGEHCLPARDCELVQGPLDILDHAAPFLGAGGKLGLDATRKSAPAELHRSLDPVATQLCAAGPIPAIAPDAARAFEARVRQLRGIVDARIPDELGGYWLLVFINKAEAGQGRATIKDLGALADDNQLPRWTLVLGHEALDTDQPGTVSPGTPSQLNLDTALFHWLAHAAPDRDRHLSKCGRRIAFDATPKLPGDEHLGLPVRPWPPLLRMSADIRDLVDRRWFEYFGDGAS